jgi:hypothetical protein
MRSRPLVEAMFSTERTCLGVLEAKDVYGSVLDAAERLLADADDVRVRGVEKLLAAGKSGIHKLEAILSELRVANMLGRLGFDVVVLADEEFGKNVYTPDLLAARDGLEILVEVFHGSDGGPDVMGPLDRALKANDLRFRVEYELAENLSVPGITFDERSSAEKTVDDVVKRVIEHLRGVGATASGSLSIDGHRFDYGPSPIEEGYAAGGVAAVHWLRDDHHGAKALVEIERKAVKQPRLPPKRRETPFIVAYDNRESELTAVTVLSALTGSRCAFSESRAGEREYWKRTNPVCHPSHVTAALVGPWGDLLKGWDFGLDADVRIRPYGALVEAPWARNLSGVLVTHVHGWVQWFPNPFADSVLCEPKLLELGLPLRGLEATHSAWHRYP